MTLTRALLDLAKALTQALLSILGTLLGLFVPLAGGAYLLFAHGPQAEPWHCLSGALWIYATVLLTWTGHAIDTGIADSRYNRSRPIYMSRQASETTGALIVMWILTVGLGLMWLGLGFIY